VYECDTRTSPVITNARTSRGGRYAAEKMSNLREITDQRIKGDLRASSVAYQKANSYGRLQAQKLPSFHYFTFSYGDVLTQYRPINLPSKY
jgi:hypothetical protein